MLKSVLLAGATLLSLVACVHSDPLTTTLDRLIKKEGAPIEGFFALNRQDTKGIYRYSVTVQNQQLVFDAKLVPISQMRYSCGVKQAAKKPQIVDPTTTPPPSATSKKAAPDKTKAVVTAFPEFKGVVLQEVTEGQFSGAQLNLTLNKDGTAVIKMGGEEAIAQPILQDEKLAASQVVCPILGYAPPTPNWSWSEPAQYGNWCGLGHGGKKLNDPKAIDRVDTTCMTHDLCYAEKGMHDCGCDAKFITQMHKVKKAKNASKAYQDASLQAFGNKPCNCEQKPCVDLIQPQGQYNYCMTIQALGMAGQCAKI